MGHNKSRKQKPSKNPSIRSLHTAGQWRGFLFYANSQNGINVPFLNFHFFNNLLLVIY
jgi:hypothetical protein